MLNQSVAHPVYTEDLSLETGAAALDTIQYHDKDFDFWKEQPLRRNVARYFQRVGARRNEEKDSADLSETVSQDLAHEDAVLDFPTVFRARTIGEQSVNTLQEWECVVTDIEKDIVTATARSLLTRNPEVEFMDVPLSEFPVEERQNLTSGVVFRIIVGFVKKPNGTRTRESVIYLRHRLPKRRRDMSSLLELLSDD